MYDACRLFQAFDPSFASNVTNEWIDNLCQLCMLQSVDKKVLKAQLPAYKAAAEDWTVDHTTVESFTNQTLRFWKQAHPKHTSAWRSAARIVFALSPNSAASERVFSQAHPDVW